MVVTGVRWAESLNRRQSQGLATIYDPMKGEELPDMAERTKKGGVILNSDNGEAREFLESCYRLKKTVVNPIIDWEDEDVWEFIHKYDVPYCELYDQGYVRLGCIGCPMTHRAADELDHYPKYKNIYLMAFAKMLKARDEAGLPREWQTPEDVMEWWLGDRARGTKPIEGQIAMELDNIQAETDDDMQGVGL